MIQYRFNSFMAFSGFCLGLCFLTTAWSQETAPPAQAEKVDSKNALESPEEEEPETTSESETNTVTPEKSPQNFEYVDFAFTTPPTVFGTIEKITETGEVHLRTSPIGYPEGVSAPKAKPDLDFLVITSPSPQPEGIHPVMKILKARFQAEPEDEQAVLLIDPEHREQLHEENQLAVIRPNDLTNADLANIPSLAHVNYNHQPAFSAEGMKTQKTFTNLNLIAQALRKYRDKHKAYPPAVLTGPDGKAWHSWRVLLLPFLDQQELFDQYQFNEPWDSEANLKLLSQMPEVYQNQYDDQPDNYFTHAAMVTGSLTAFDTVEFDGTKEGLEKISGKKIEDITDDMNMTILGGLVSPKAEIKWTQPRDLSFAEFAGMDETKGFFAPLEHENYKSKYGVIFSAAGHVQFVNANADKHDLIPLLTIAGGESGEQEMLQRINPKYHNPYQGRAMKNVPYIVIYPHAEDFIAHYYNKQVPVEEQ